MKMIELEGFGCFVGTSHNTLFYAPTLLSGGFSEPIEVVEPYEQSFLDEANAVLGTNFKLTDFAGRGPKH